MTDQLPIQDLIGDENHCYGCGPQNPHGLRIKSYLLDDETAECRFRPAAHHCAGSTDVLNGGVVSTLIDCHCVNLAMANAYRREGREVGSAPKIWYVTGKLEVNFKAACAVNQELVLKAKVKSVEGRKTLVECDLVCDGKICDSGQVLAIRIGR